MSTKTNTKYWLGAASALAVAISAGGALAQQAGSTIRGSISDGGAPEAGAVVTATEAGSGFVSRVTANANGAYVIPGLRPGSYRVTVTTAEGETASETVNIAVGAVGTLNLDVGTTQIASGGATDLGDIVVTGRRLAEVITSEVATNISRDQIETLPQTDRNFLSFARLAPGVRYNDGESGRTFQSGAGTANDVNVFIDGASLKNNVISGGLVGQDSSRGNPFAQLAVQEFRVLTQNYKAEYEQASAAIITAVTRSGTNEFHGELFGAYQDRDMIEENTFDARAGREKPDYKRSQYGVALGGPIIRDRLHFFGSYEGNDQDRATTVTLGNRTPENIARFGEYEGNFVTPFRADLYFGKLSWLIDDRQNLDFSVSVRKESEIRGFGGTNAFTVAEDFQNTVTTYNLRHTYRGDWFLNEASIDYLDYNWHPTSLNPGAPTYEYQNVITIGGRDSSQDIIQKGWTFRNDFTITSVDNHLIKMGVKYNTVDYEFNKLFFTAPKFTYISDRGLGFDSPSQVRLGLGDPQIAAENWIFGLYIQDDWDITPKLQLNLGLRWDYEDNMFNNDYVTPANAEAALRALPERFGYNADDYITDGNDRDRFMGAFQPRIGFSYDVFDDERTVIFGGYGRYYDRNVFNNTLDERFRLQYATGVFYFSDDGLPDPNGNATVIWDDRYYDRDALLELRATAQTGRPELFAVKNDAKPPSTDQFSLGFRQRLGEWIASATATYIKGQNGYTHVFGTLRDDGTCCDTTPATANGFSNILLGVDELDTEYTGLYLTLDKPYSRDSGWGANVAWTWSEAKQNGGDLFSLDAPRPDDYGMYRKVGSEEHTVVLSGIKDLPWGMRVSTITQLGSGAFFNIDDQSAGSGINQRRLMRGAGAPRKNCLELFARCTVDLKLEKDFELFGNQQLTLQLDVLNAFDSRNYGGFNGYIPPAPGVNPNYGRPTNLITRPRSFQVGFRYSF